MSLKPRLERLEETLASGMDCIEVIDTSGLAPWTRDNWPPWRYPEKHPIPPDWGADAVPEPSPHENEEGTPDDR